MNTVQIIALLTAAAFLAQPFVSNYIKKSQSKVDVYPKDIQPETSRAPSGPAQTDVSYVVSQWAALKNSCDQLDLKEASTALDSVFPLFVKKG